MSAQFSFTDQHGHELALYREGNTIAVDVIVGDKSLEAQIGGPDLDLLIIELTKLRDTIAANPSKEN